MNNKHSCSLLHWVLLLCAASILCLLFHSISIFRYAVYVDEHIGHPLNSLGLSQSVMSFFQLSLIPAYLLMFIFSALNSKRVCNFLGAVVSIYSLVAAVFCITNGIPAYSIYGSMTYWVFECIKIIVTVACAPLSICIIRQNEN